MAGILPFGAVFIELFFILSVSNQNEVSFLPEVNSCYRNSSLIITSNPFTLLSDQGGISLYSINTFSRSRVMRKKKCIYIRNRTLFDLVLNSQNKNDTKWMRDSAENVHFDLESGRIEELLKHQVFIRLKMLQNNQFKHQLYVHRDMKHLGSLESTQEARVALGYASSNSYASLVLSKLPAYFISQWTHADAWTNC